MVRPGELVSVPVILHGFGEPGIVEVGKYTLLVPLFQFVVMTPLQLPRIELAPMLVMVIEPPPLGVIVQGKPDGETSRPHCQSPGLKLPPVIVAELPSAATVPFSDTLQLMVVDCSRVKAPDKTKDVPAGLIDCAMAGAAKPAMARTAAEAIEAALNMSSPPKYFTS